MKTKNKKLLAIGTGVMAVALGVGVFASLGHDGLLLRSKASKDGSVTFTRTTNPASGTYASGVYTIESAVGKTGLTAVASVNAESNAATYAFRFGTSTDHKVEISLADNVYHAATFQSITTISFEISSTYTPDASFGVYYSSNGVFNDTDKMTVNVANPSVDLSEVDAKFVKFVNDSGNYAYVSNFTIGFSCTNYSNYLTSLIISGVTYEWNNNQTFEFDGTATAHYFDGSSKDVSSSVYFDAPAMTPGYKQIPIYYSENGMRVSAVAYIHVNDIVKSFTYCAQNAFNGETATFADAVDENSSSLPSTGEIGQTIQMEAVLNSGYNFVGWNALDDDTREYIDNYLDYTDNPLSFTVQEFDSEMVIMYVPDLDRITISNPKTEFYVGDSFSLGDGVVTATFVDNYTMSPIDLSNLAVTGFNSTAVAQGQNVTISFTFNGITKSTTISVNISEKPSGDNLNFLLNGTYSVMAGNYRVDFIFDGAGAGRMRRYYNSAENYPLYFEYEVDLNYGLTVTYASDSRTTYFSSYPQNYRPGDPNNTSTWTNTTGVVDSSGNSFTIKLYNSVGGYHLVDSPYTFSR